MRRALDKTEGKALTMPQYEKPELNALYLAKLGLIDAAVRAYGDILWLDAGYLFSQKYRHQVPEGWKGYDRAGLDALLGGTMADYARRGRPYLSGFYRKPRWYKPRKEFLHGATWSQMSRLARHFHARRDRIYVNASLLFIPGAYWRERYPFLVEIWKFMEAQGIPGTEENVLSVLRWVDGLDTFSVEDGPDYMLGLRYPPS